jgi:hypothetical protein
LNDLNQVLVCDYDGGGGGDSDVNLLGEDVKTIKKNREIFYKLAKKLVWK